MREVICIIFVICFGFMKVTYVYSQVKKDFNMLLSSNGFGAVVFSTVKRKIVAFFPSIYKQYDEKTPPVTSILRGLDYIIDINNNSIKLSDTTLVDVNYIPGTGIVKAIFRTNDIDINLYVFSSFLISSPSFIVKIEVFTKERGILSVIRSLSYSGRFEVKALDEKNLGQYIQVSKDSTILFQLSSIKDDNEKIYIYDYVIASESIDVCKNILNFYLSDSKDALESEMSFWSDWHKETKIPNNLSKDQLDLYKQSLAFIKMGQVREKSKGYGQILASLPTGVWNIAWVRDGVYSIIALILSGHYKEAKDALTFFFESDTGYYKNYFYNGTNYGIGMDYKISVCRYYGSGKEESDDNGNGPNIELDGFGMVLWAFSEYVKKSEDAIFLSKYSNLVYNYVALPLMRNVDEFGYIRPDSGPWERHIKDDGYDGAKRFSYTLIMAIKGLEELYSILKYPDLESTKNTLKKTFLSHFIDEKLRHIFESYEHIRRGIPKYIGGSTVEAINFGIVDKETALKNLEAYEKYLGIRNKSERYGFMRNLDGGWYDSQEWVIIDLRIASAYRKLGLKEKAKNIVNWIEKRALNAFYMIPELFSNDEKAEFKGAVPMLGFGAGAYVMYLWGY